MFNSMVYAAQAQRFHRFAVRGLASKCTPDKRNFNLPTHTVSPLRRSILPVLCRVFWQLLPVFSATLNLQL